MKSEKEIEDEFNKAWKELGTNEDDFMFINGFVAGLDWVMDGKLIQKKRNEVIE